MHRLALLSGLMIGACVTAANAGGVDRLYVLDCGSARAPDQSRWSPGVNVGKSMDFVDNCYLIKHSQGWLLWDTGVTDAIAAMPDGQKPADAATVTLFQETRHRLQFFRVQRPIIVRVGCLEALHHQ